MDITTAAKNRFTSSLSHWHRNYNNRSLPWKGEKDPYKIWLSEIILQQTRAAQGLPYYMAFTEAYPTVNALAAANDTDVFRLWQGLGYYNRCKNMLATARIITSLHDGLFPNKCSLLLTLKGIGPYTAAAIASFAFNEPVAVVDGNVYRVLSRCFGIDTPIDSTAGKKIFAELAQQLLHLDDSAAHNQAIMDLGATVCTPSLPKCDQCPLTDQCVAIKSSLIEMLPIKTKKIVVKQRHFNYILLLHDDKIWIQKRSAGDIWENLHEPYLIETNESADIKTLLKDSLLININPKDLIWVAKSKQRLTHQLINTSFYSLVINDLSSVVAQNGEWISNSDLKNLAFPKTLVSFFKNNLYF
jgi:A/G-specific adenine glycosylase